jgi:SAM-dependent methyltransferase
MAVMDWVKGFYSRQNEWGEVYLGDVTDLHRKRAETLNRLAGGGGKRILDLGAGGGQNAAALADLGHIVVAVEFESASLKNAHRLASQSRKGKLIVMEGDFYEIELGDKFDVICYLDGFGIGSDADQRRLLKRITGWLGSNGCVLLEVGTPWYWAKAVGRSWQVGQAIRRYDLSV